MPYLTAIITSLVCLTAVCAIYGCRVFAQPASWLRGELIDMLLIALLSGFFPLALTASIIGIWDDLSNGFSLSALQSAGLDFLGLVLVFLTFVIFIAAARATAREASNASKAGIGLDQNNLSIG